MPGFDAVRKFRNFLDERVALQLKIHDHFVEPFKVVSVQSDSSRVPPKHVLAESPTDLRMRHVPRSRKGGTGSGLARSMNPHKNEEWAVAVEPGSVAFGTRQR